MWWAPLQRHVHFICWGITKWFEIKCKLSTLLIKTHLHSVTQHSNIHRTGVLTVRIPTQESLQQIRPEFLEALSVHLKVWTRACKSSLFSHSIFPSSPPFSSSFLLLSVFLQWICSSRNWRTKYQHNRSSWQFNFNAWLSVNLIIILSNHPINVFYIYNDHRVSSQSLHHSSRVRYWTHKRPRQLVREAFWLRYKRLLCVCCHVRFSVCITLWRHPHRSSSIRSFTLHGACWRDTERAKDEAKRRVGKPMVKDFRLPHRSHSSAVCSVLLRGESGLLYWRTNTQSRGYMSNLLRHWCLCFLFPDAPGAS